VTSADRPGREGSRACSLCGGSTPAADLAEAGWAPPAVRSRILREHPEWRRREGACPACVQEALLTILLERGDAALHDGVQAAWPLDPGAAFGALPTPLRMHADPRITGRGVTIALVDAAFHPHRDLVGPPNRIRAWIDAGCEPATTLMFGPDDLPSWPGSADGAGPQWHGLMTSAVAAGDGRSSHGLYRGMAPAAGVVLVQAREPGGAITSASIGRALTAIAGLRDALGIGIVSLSVSGDADAPLADNPVDGAIEALVAAGVVVIAAAGNDGERRLIPPATAPAAITVGGLDDRNNFDHRAMALWHGNYGETVAGAAKPELVAPSLWVVAPLLPGTAKAREAERLFDGRVRADETDVQVEDRIRELQLVTPYYQIVDGTSVAAPIVAGVAAGMLQANPELTPATLRAALLAACRAVPGAPAERQGAGALDAGQAVSRARRARHGPMEGRPPSPIVDADEVRFTLHDHDVREVRVCGSWDDWSAAGLPARRVGPGLFEAVMSRPAPGRYAYKFLLDEARWIDDPDNPHKEQDGFGRLHSILDLHTP